MTGEAEIMPISRKIKIPMDFLSQTVYNGVQNEIAIDFVEEEQRKR